MRFHLGDGTFEGRRLIAAEALAETHRPQIISRRPRDPATDRAGFYGLGWNVNYDETSRVRLGHSGGFCLGAATVVALLPSEQLGIVVLTNAAPIGVPEATSASFLDLVLYGEVKQDWLEVIRPAFDGLCQPEDGTATDSAVPAAQASPSLSFDAYLGTYSNDYFGEIGIVAGDGGLALQLGPRKTAFALQPQDRDVFIYQTASSSRT